MDHRRSRKGFRFDGSGKVVCRATPRRPDSLTNVMLFGRFATNRGDIPDRRIGERNRVLVSGPHPPRRLAQPRSLKLALHSVGVGGEIL